jgi:hypothetical protein
VTLPKHFLRVPQGTLSGRNSIGAAILLVPTKATYEFGSYIKGTGNVDYKDAEHAVNVPLVKDKTAVRLGESRALLRET